MTTHRTVAVGPTSAAGIISVVWFAAALLLGWGGAFAAAADSPPVALGVAVAGPPLVVVGLLIWSSAFRAWARSVDLRFLTMLHMWRFGGIVFLALLANDALPAAFAIPAGGGDVLVALVAPFVIVSIGRGAPAKTLYIAWTVFGIVDLVAAVALGVLHASGPLGLFAGAVTTDDMAMLPLSIIPTFFVPFLLSVHVISLVALRGTAWRSAG